MVIAQRPCFFEVHLHDAQFLETKSHQDAYSKTPRERFTNIDRMVSECLVYSRSGTLTSFSLTCRRRRIKCDEGRPTCKSCSRSNRDCQYADTLEIQPQDNLENVADTANDNGTRAFTPGTSQEIGQHSPDLFPESIKELRSVHTSQSFPDQYTHYIFVSTAYPPMGTLHFSNQHYPTRLPQRHLTGTIHSPRTPSITSQKTSPQKPTKPINRSRPKIFHVRRLNIFCGGSQHSTLWLSDKPFLAIYDIREGFATMTSHQARVHHGTLPIRSHYDETNMPFSITLSAT